ncbi:MAG TPA: POT family MFS transporter [Pirellulales bacterium]|jgi:POT family proton-dependent oligopeptide transporter|nr:POT family MFS transporter [Pirellulales bacterium]
MSELRSPSANSDAGIDPRSGYRIAPEPRTTMPPGIPYIVGNEAAERFSYYGMLAILQVFMTEGLLDAAGNVDVMSEARATEWLHNFMTACYFLPLGGALLAETLLGKYRTIFWLSLFYCLGHAALAFDETRTGLVIGLSLIAIGAGGIKPCVSANVGDQFGESNQHLLEKVFGWFYFSINFGSAIATYLIPELREKLGYHVAFGVPGILMAVAAFTFWAGRKKFVHIPPAGRRFFSEISSPQGLGAIARLVPLYLCVAFFWAQFDQTHSRWVTQAKAMNRDVFGWQVKPEQMQAVNPILVLLFIPLFTYVVYPALSRVVKLTPLRKIGIGFTITITTVALVAWLQGRIDAGDAPHVAWQAAAYVLMTAAEVMVSITFLEFSYTQAPRSMKSLVMALYLLSVAAGNFFVSQVNRYIADHPDDSGLEGAAYYWFFLSVMFAATLSFLFVAMFYTPHTYIQDEQP